ncbi:liprin-beta-2b isoform X3 [Lates japonicus]|uniref:Liprin-beta-2b isoform X3 n=1 Tax=Lates japonicus TaxID=270547 RepID=A0AAD3N415_LATJO|nr:liprin-beta-2b isoform X3 [Lates japonicus]
MMASLGLKKWISSRIQEKQALQEREAQVGEPGGSQAQGPSPQLELTSSDLSLSGSDAWMHNGGQTVHDLLQEVKQLKSKVEELEGEKSQYERKLRATKLSISYSLHVCYQSLMTQLSSLKLTVEHTQLEKQHWEERWRSAQAEISELQQLLASKDAEIECLQTQLLARDGTANDNAERDQEYQRLKVGMESLLASNDEKDRRIEELTILLGQYRKIREVMALTQGSSEEELSGSLKLRAITHKAHSDILRSEISSRGSSPLMLSSSPYQRELDISIQNSVDTSLVFTGETSFLNGSWHQRRLLSSSLEELQSGSTVATPGRLTHRPTRPQQRHHDYACPIGLALSQDSSWRNGTDARRFRGSLSHPGQGETQDQMVDHRHHMHRKPRLKASTTSHTCSARRSCRRSSGGHWRLNFATSTIPTHRHTVYLSRAGDRSWEQVVDLELQKLPDPSCV